MGYDTSYSVKIIEGHAEIPKLIEMSHSAKFGINDWGISKEPIGWVEHEKDLKKFSKKFPDSVIELSGEGEEAEDIWKKYFCNGKMQVCKAEITYPLFDPKKLK